MLTIPFNSKNRQKILQEQSNKGLVNNGEMNLHNGNFLTFVTPEEIKDKFDEWLKNCPDEKIKEWIFKGREFFK